MMRFPIRRLAVPVLLAVSALTLSGCWNPFAPDPGDPQDPPNADYRDRLTPEDVIHNLKTAYEWMNAVEYLDCLSEDFIFYPNEDDVQNPDLNIPPEWYKTQSGNLPLPEIKESSCVESITLTLTNVSIEYVEGLPGDPSDDIYIYVEDVDLRVNLYGGLTYLATADSEYHFRVDIDQQGEEGEIWWEVYLWYDLDTRGGSGVRDDPNIEHVSLSELKSMFLQ